MRRLAVVAVVLVGVVAGAGAQRGGARGGAVGGGAVGRGGPGVGAPAFHGGYSAPVRPSYGGTGFVGGMSGGVRPGGAGVVRPGVGQPAGLARVPFYSRNGVRPVGGPRRPSVPVWPRAPFYGVAYGGGYVGYGYPGYGYLGYGDGTLSYGDGAGYSDGSAPDVGNGDPGQGAAEPSQQDQPDAYGTYPPLAPAAEQAGPTATFGTEEVVTLVFKDGRPTEQIRNYVLTRTTLYVVGERHREIPVEALDLAATEKVNREAGVTFALPGK